jgi:hypothetical protein
LRTNASANALRGDARAAVGAGQQHDRQVLRLGRPLELRAEVEAVRAGHVHVEDDDVRATRVDLAPRNLGALGLDNVDVRNLERRPQQRPERRIVVDQQDPQDTRPPIPVPETVCRHVARRT